MDVRGAIWDITLPDVLRLLGLQRSIDFTTNEQKMELTLPNGSIIICSGTDDKARLDQILGREYATIYANEANDISYLIFVMLGTRLSQLIKGCTNRFIVDLNPGGEGHWTHKIWFRGIKAQSLLPLENPEHYGKLQLNPYENRANLADNYIEDMLEPLTGDQRERFLNGNYQSNNELLVFRTTDRNYFELSSFQAWANGRYGSIRIIGGLDLGYQNADAFSLIAYCDGDPIAYVLYEYKAYRAELADLAAGIRKGLNWINLEIPWYPNSQLIPIYSDTNTIRYGKEGDKKKNWAILMQMYGFNTMTAFKRDKDFHVEFMRTLWNDGNLKIQRGGPFDDERAQIVWTKNPTDGTIEHIIDDEVYHPDTMFSILYALNYILSYGNTAWNAQKEAGVQPDPIIHAAKNYEKMLRDQEELESRQDALNELLGSDEQFF